ncbi:MAG: glycoside hydrolase family 130 protein [Dysgonamonadaceae bacterium]|jgi:predicted GH43/DUF377 family glycosyl hydrolase|nr:glycoside hydrolase family 130 protein [Dysgonamonadaceae bacterium]
MKTNCLLLLLSGAVACSACGEKKTTRDVSADAGHYVPVFPMEPFIRPEAVNPVISPNDATRFFDPLLQDSIAWESNDTFNPAAAVLNDEIVVLYRAEDQSGKGIGQRTSRLGYASSGDGLHFTRRSTPVFYPDNDSQKELEWPGGCEDPRIALSENGLYVMLYTQWNRQLPRLAVATSPDLVHWTKHGPAFAKAYDGRFYNEFSKSASVITRLKNGKQVIAEIKGRYWMYWGEKAVYAATSDNLTDWYPVLDENNRLKVLYAPREGYFDSELTECGPPAVLTEQGIVLLYNGKNKAGTGGDTDYTANAYCAGQALFDAEEPTQLLQVSDKPFLVPQESFEKSGQYPAGTVFIEGLVYFQNKWFLYYGCADSRVAVAIYNPKYNEKI